MLLSGQDTRAFDHDSFFALLLRIEIAQLKDEVRSKRTLDNVDDSKNTIVAIMLTCFSGFSSLAAAFQPAALSMRLPCLIMPSVRENDGCVVELLSMERFALITFGNMVPQHLKGFVVRRFHTQPPS